VKLDIAAVIAMSFLVAVAVALLCAGLYALFGKPSTHGGKERKQQVVSGFILGGGILLGIVLMGGLVGGSGVAFGIIQSTRPSRVAALFAVVASLLLTFSMIRYWAKHFAGWLAYGVFNGLLMVSSGHAVNDPSIAVPRWLSISVTILIFASASVCLRFAKKYMLNAADKAALMTWLLAFSVAVNIENTHAVYREQIALGAMLVGYLALVAAWQYHRATRRHHSLVVSMRSSTEQSPL
jgi:hypothetical protein